MWTLRGVCGTYLPSYLRARARGSEALLRWRSLIGLTFVRSRNLFLKLASCCSSDARRCLTALQNSIEKARHPLGCNINPKQSAVPSMYCHATVVIVWVPREILAMSGMFIQHARCREKLVSWAFIVQFWDFGKMPSYSSGKQTQW